MKFGCYQFKIESVCWPRIPKTQSFRSYIQVYNVNEVRAKRYVEHFCSSRYYQWIKIYTFLAFDQTGVIPEQPQMIWWAIASLPIISGRPSDTQCTKTLLKISVANSSSCDVFSPTETVMVTVIISDNYCVVQHQSGHKVILFQRRERKARILTIKSYQ